MVDCGHEAPRSGCPWGGGCRCCDSCRELCAAKLVRPISQFSTRQLTRELEQHQTQERAS